MKGKTIFLIGVLLAVTLTPAALFWLVGVYPLPEFRSTIIATHSMFIVFGLLLVSLTHFKE